MLLCYNTKGEYQMKQKVCDICGGYLKLLSSNQDAGNGVLMAYGQCMHCGSIQPWHTARDLAGSED